MHVARAVTAKTTGMTVLWIGRPDWQKVLRWSMLFWIFAVPWTVFSVSWTLGAAAMIWGSPSDNMPSTMRTVIGVVFPLWGVPFVAIGVGMMAAPFWMARKAFNTAHILTTESLITLTATPTGSVDIKSVHVGRVQGTSLHEWRDGTGTVKIHIGWKTDSDGDRVKDEETWICVPEAAKVERLIQKMMPQERPAAA